MITMEAQCPTVDVQNSTCGANMTYYSLGRVLCYIGMVSNTLSCLGSVAIVLIYLAWKDLRRKGAQSIITYLTIADFCTSFSYLVGSVNILEFSGESHAGRCEVYSTVCQIESYVVTWSSMTSYLWASILAFYFYFSIVYDKPVLALQLMPLYHVIAWGVPILIVLPLLCVGKLAYAPYVSGVWCYMNVPSEFYKRPFLGERPEVQVLVKLPEIFGYILILVFYTATRVSIHRKLSRQDQLAVARNRGVRRLNTILQFIPIVFIMQRMWCTVQFFYSVQVAGLAYRGNGCIPVPVKYGYLFLGLLQGIGAGGQGWINAVIYIFLSKEMRKRLFWIPSRKLASKMSRERQMMMSSSNTVWASSNARSHVPCSDTYFSPPVSHPESDSAND